MPFSDGKISEVSELNSVSERVLCDTMESAMQQRISEIKTVALYARVSTRDKGQDTENQLIALREYAGKQGWSIFTEYVDHDRGGKANRTQFQKMFADAEKRQFDLLLFWSLDRFSREGVRDTLNHLQRLTSSGVEWKSFSEQYLDSVGIFKDAVLAILAVVAKQETVRRSERAAAAIARLRRQKNTEHLGRPRVVVDRAKIMQLHQDGQSCRQIASRFGISSATVNRIIRKGS